MKGVTNMAIAMIILLVLGLVVLLVVSGFVRGSESTLSNVQKQDRLITCCNRYLPECNNPGIVCYKDGNDDVTIQELANELNLNLRNACGC